MQFYISLAAIGLCASFTTIDVFARTKTEVTLPTFIDLGLGFGRLHSDVDITSNNQAIYSFKPNLSGQVEPNTLIKHKDKLPSDIPKFILKSGLSYSPFPLPSSIYFTRPEDGDDKVYGFSYGPSIGAGIGGIIRLGGSIGLDATYLYMETDQFDENHFLSIGANAAYSLTIKPIKYFHLELGQKHTWNIEHEMSNGRYLGRFREDYVMLHFRFPYDAKVEM